MNVERSSPTDRAALGLLVLTLALLALAAAAAWAPRHPATTHPTFSGILEGATPDGHVSIAGALFGAGVIALLAAVATFGFARQGSWGGWGPRLAAATVVYLLVWIVLVALELAGVRGLLGSLPAPTALVVYGIWPVPLLFAWLWMRAFDSWVWTDEDRKRLAEIRDRGEEGR